MPKRFSDFSEEDLPLDGDKIRIDDILNCEINIVGFRICKSKYDKNKSGKCLTLQFKNGSEDKRVIFTGSDVLIDQMNKYGEEIPFHATIKKIDKYYTLT
ncbi:MAG: hypothetical protein H8E14_13500 [Candidatus Marinimicrobia bacterium]|nr:hypothetical protein [Candidatus Neomarinimicrobiota bacterium]